MSCGIVPELLYGTTSMDTTGNLTSAWSRIQEASFYPWADASDDLMHMRMLNKPNATVLDYLRD